MAEPTSTGIFIGINHFLAALGGLIAALWGTWKLIFSRVFLRIEKLEDSVKEIERNQIESKVIASDVKDIKEGQSELHQRVDDIWKGIVSMLQDKK